MKHLVPSGLALLLLGACSGTTGDELITFPAYAAGAQHAGDPFSVNGYTIQLSYAHMYIGAIYVNEAPAQNGSTFNTPACIDQGVYSAQVTGGLDVDLLSTTPQAFPVQGTGTTDVGLSWELYVVQGDVNAPQTTGFGVPHTADLVGKATRDSDGRVFSWAATVTVDASNRGEPPQSAGQPGSNPICKQRIIDLADLDLHLSPGGSLLLTIDPRGWFKLPIAFSSLPSVESPQCTTDQNSMYENADYCIPDSSNLGGGVLGSQDAINLFKGIRTGGTGAYALTYSPP